MANTPSIKFNRKELTIFAKFYCRHFDMLRDGRFKILWTIQWTIINNRIRASGFIILLQEIQSKKWRIRNRIFSLLVFGTNKPTNVIIFNLVRRLYKPIANVCLQWKITICGCQSHVTLVTVRQHLICGIFTQLNQDQGH